MTPTEHQEQASLFAEAMLRSAQDPRWGLLLAIPNGGLRSKATAGKLKAEGVRAGVPDLFLPVPMRNDSGLWIEMKRSVGGRLSTEQVWWMHQLMVQGYRVMRCNGAEAAVQVILDYLGKPVAGSAGRK